jgi:hypothetical protein
MIPEPIDALDELATVNTAYGPMQKWKARSRRRLDATKDR